MAAEGVVNAEARFCLGAAVGTSLVSLSWLQCCSSCLLSQHTLLLLSCCTPGMILARTWCFFCYYRYPFSTAVPIRGQTSLVPSYCTQNGTGVLKVLLPRYTKQMSVVGASNIKRRTGNAACYCCLQSVRIVRPHSIASTYFIEVWPRCCCCCCFCYCCWALPLLNPLQQQLLLLLLLLLLHRMICMYSSMYL